MKVTGIKWDTYGEDVELPTEVELPDNMVSYDEDYVWGYLYGKFGYCPDTWGDITGSSGMKRIWVTFEVCSRYAEPVEIPSDVNDSDIEDYLDRHGILDKIESGAEREAHKGNFDDCDYSIVNEKGRDIKPWR